MTDAHEHLSSEPVTTTSSTLATPMEQKWAREDRQGSNDAWESFGRVVLIGFGIAFLVALIVWAAVLFGQSST